MSRTSYIVSNTLTCSEHRRGGRIVISQNDIFAQFEQTLDECRSNLALLPDLLRLSPQFEMQANPFSKSCEKLMLLGEEILSYVELEPHFAGFSFSEEWLRDFSVELRVNFTLAANSYTTNYDRKKTLDEISLMYTSLRPYAKLRESLSVRQDLALKRASTPMSSKEMIYRRTSTLGTIVASMLILVAVAIAVIALFTTILAYAPSTLLLGVIVIFVVAGLVMMFVTAYPERTRARLSLKA